MFLDYKPGAGSLSEMNLTPLVDVMMVLMIIFMVTSSQDPAGIDLDLPDADAVPVASDKGRVTIYMELNEKITVTKGEKKKFVTDLKGLSSILKLNFSGEISADIKGDKNLKYQKIMTLMVETRKAGFSKLGLLIDRTNHKDNEN